MKPIAKYLGGFSRLQGTGSFSVIGVAMYQIWSHAIGLIRLGIYPMQCFRQRFVHIN